MTTLNAIVIRSPIFDENGQSSDVFVAIGIEHYLVAQADTPEAAFAGLERALMATVQANTSLHQGLLLGIAPAPQAYQDEFLKLQQAGKQLPVKNNGNDLFRIDAFAA